MIFDSSKYPGLFPVFCFLFLLLLSACKTTSSAQPALSPIHPALTGSVYVASIREDASSDLLALQPATGRIRWRRHIAVNTPALLATSAVVYAVGGLETLTGSRIYAFDTRTGGLLWQTELKSFGLLWMQSAHGFLYLAGPVDGHIYAVRTSDGMLLWQKMVTNTSSFMTLVLQNDLLYAPSFRDGTLYALHVQDGSLSWKYQSDLTVLSLLSLAGSHLSLLAQNKGASQGALFVLDAIRGTLLWQYRLQQSVLTSLTFAGTQIAVTSANGGLFLLHIQDGSLFWKTSLSVKGELSAPLITAQQMFVVSNSEHRLSVLDLQTGRLLWQTSIPCFAVQHIEQVKDRLYLLSQSDGSLCALRSQNGSVLWHTILASPQKSASFLPLRQAFDQLYAVSPETGLLYVLHQSNGVLAWQMNLGAFEDGIPAPLVFAS